MDPTRLQALEDLVTLRTPIAEAAARLRDFPWDSEIEYVTLSRLDAERVLDAVIEDRLDAPAVCAWANAIEGRDDIGFDADHEDELKEFVFAMANPEINGRLSPEVASRWKARLRS
jgi:hypothetical protein